MIMHTLPTVDEFGKTCRKAITKGGFQQGSLDDLDDWTHKLVQHYLNGMTWSVVKLSIGYIIKLDDEFLKYLITMPMGTFYGQAGDRHFWLSGTDPNNPTHTVSAVDALIYLVRKRRSARQ